MRRTAQVCGVSTKSRYPRLIGHPAVLWLLLYVGLVAILYAIFRVGSVATPADPLLTAAASAGVVTGLSLFAVVVDRVVFTRHPEDLLTRQSPWVLVLVGLTVLASAGLALTGAAPTSDAVLFGLAISLPLTMLLFAAVNIARYRTMEHGE